MWRDLSDFPRLASSLNKPCWHGYCFNQAVLDMCKLDTRPDFKPANGMPTAGQVFEMLFTGQAPMDKVSIDLMDESAPGCKTGCRELLEFVKEKADESLSGSPSSGVSPFDIEFPEAVNNTVTVCEATFKVAMGIGEEGEKNEGEELSGMEDTSWDFRQCLHSQCSACFPMNSEGKVKQRE